MWYISRINSRTESQPVVLGAETDGCCSHVRVRRAAARSVPAPRAQRGDGDAPSHAVQEP